MRCLQFAMNFGSVNKFLRLFNSSKKKMECSQSYRAHTKATRGRGQGIRLSQPLFELEPAMDVGACRTVAARPNGHKQPRKFHTKMDPLSRDTSCDRGSVWPLFIFNLPHVPLIIQLCSAPLLVQPPVQLCSSGSARRPPPACGSSLTSATEPHRYPTTHCWSPPPSKAYIVGAPSPPPPPSKLSPNSTLGHRQR
jgi:hypothetical protein